MAKKKKTLPKNYKELIEAKDLSALKAMYATCEINAYNNGVDKKTVLHTFGVPDELVRWLAGQSADINARDHYGRTPLFEQASIGSDSVAALLELGADIEAADNNKNTPLHIAARFHHPNTVQTLLARGADIHAKNDRGHVPLQEALSSCRNGDIPQTAAIAAILLAAGAAVTPETREAVLRIGKEFEFYRADFNKDYLAETEAGLARLYALFGVAPVSKRLEYDGVSPITVPSGKWHEQHDALWQLLVPGRGSAKTVQGEVIRLSGKLAREIMDNGGMNWDEDFRRMLAALVEYFGMGTPLVPDEREEAVKIAKLLRGGNGDEEPERLMELAVHWVQANPNPILLDKTDYSR
ncbi:ankyrin repeat domain-containing protein [Breznakiellaceae bacterium SP9]